MKASKRFKTDRQTEKSSQQGKNSKEKKQEKCFEEEIIDAPHQKFYMLMLLSINDEVSSISSQIVEQIQIIPEAVLSEVSKLIDSLMSNKQGDQRK